MCILKGDKSYNIYWALTWARYWTMTPLLCNTDVQNFGLLRPNQRGRLWNKRENCPTGIGNNSSSSKLITFYLFYLILSLIYESIKWIMGIHPPYKHIRMKLKLLCRSSTKQFISLYISNIQNYLINYLQIKHKVTASA